MNHPFVNQAQPAQGVEHIVPGHFELSRNDVFRYINTPVVDSIADTPHFALFRRIPGVYKPETDSYAYSLGPTDPPVRYTNVNVSRHHQRLYNVSLNAFNEMIRLQGTPYRVDVDANDPVAVKARYKEICKVLMQQEVRNFILAYNLWNDHNMIVPPFVGR